MFGALNRFIARLDAEPQSNGSPGQNAFGFQVLKNSHADTPIEPWFDYIIGINGRTIDNPDPNLFATEIRNCAGNSISLGIWSAKGQRIRELYVTVPEGTKSIGLALQWSPLTLSEDVWHILEVTPGSPADQAGLLPYGDYVIGTPHAVMRGESGLGELVEDHLNSPITFYVYNHEYNVTRTVEITPSRSWGGSGALGCILGFGALHRLPAPLDEPPQGPGETLFETTRFSNEDARPSALSDPSAAQGQFLNAGGVAGANPSSAAPTFMVPADMNSAAGPPKSSTAGRKARVHHHHATAATGLDDFLAEGEAKSREEDGVSPRPGKAGIAPPPKSGTGPPPRAAAAASPADAETASPADEIESTSNAAEASTEASNPTSSPSPSPGLASPTLSGIAPSRSATGTPRSAASMLRPAALRSASNIKKEEEEAAKDDSDLD